MNLIKPKKLKKGDTISIIAPSGPVDIAKIELAKQYFVENGYNVILGEYLYEQNNYLAGDDEKRLSDLHSAFKNKDVNAIICARGGYGTLRLSDKIDFQLINNNPKILCGYSDITILNALLLKKSNLITFSGPMIQSDFADSTCKFTLDNFFEALTNDTLSIKPKYKKIYYKGECEGTLFGGNLATLASLCGQDFVPDKKFIFFVEDLNEQVYKIDKYFTQLLHIQKFKNNLAGVVIGDFLNIDNPKHLEDYLIQLANDLKIPFVGGYQISHAQEKVTLPFGADAKLTTDNLILTNFIDE